MNYELIEVATDYAPWVFSWWHIGILVVVLGVLWFFCIRDMLSGRMVGENFLAGLFFSLILTCLWTLSIAPGANKILEPEAERVAAEISSVTGVPVDAEDVRTMKRGDYVEGVNYDRMTDSDGDLVFKVEVK